MYIFQLNAQQNLANLFHADFISKLDGQAYVTRKCNHVLFHSRKSVISSLFIVVVQSDLNSYGFSGMVSMQRLQKSSFYFGNIQKNSSFAAPKIVISTLFGTK